MHYRNFITIIRLPSVCVLCGMLALPLPGEMTAEAPKQPNVLFIAIDVSNEIPKDTDGISIVPTLLGKGEQQKHEYLYPRFRNGTTDKHRFTRIIKEL